MMEHKVRATLTLTPSDYERLRGEIDALLAAVDLTAMDVETIEIAYWLPVSRQGTRNA